MICIDSDCIIDFLKNRANAVGAVQKWKHEMVTTEISRFQVLFGIFNKPVVSERELNAAREFFSRLDVLPFNDNCGESAAELLAALRRRGEVIDEADCLIAASMKVHGCLRILSGNAKHFGRIPELSVVSY